MLLNSRECSRRTRRTTDIRSLALLAAGAIAIAGCVSTGCVSTGQYTEVEQERDVLAARNEALEADLRRREDEARKLKETYDGLVKSLKKELSAGQVEVTQLRDGLRVNVSQDILFDSGSAALDDSGMAVLRKVAAELKNSSHQILVIGHTDNKPIRPALARTYPSNWELAGARAASVVRLFSRSGLSSTRMRAVSVADTQPVASNKTEEGRSRNRRIEIRVRPIAPEGQSS